MITQDVAVYDDGGTHYVANFTDDGWVRWPAERGGWRQRQPCPASLADDCFELPPRLSQLALLLTGVDA